LNTVLTISQYSIGEDIAKKKISGEPSEEQKKLQDKTIDKVTFLKTLRGACAEAVEKKYDAFLMYYSGHGN
jgi:hypothetical protein